MSGVYRVLATHVIDADNPEHAVQLINDDTTIVMAVEDDFGKWRVTPKGLVLTRTRIDGQWFQLVTS